MSTLGYVLTAVLVLTVLITGIATVIDVWRDS